ncbi:FKBP-type peptidyl-prolyl cis-trans isomerase N-terminal domain-containing protein [candidate division KSB1 bacterium]
MKKNFKMIALLLPAAAVLMIFTACDRGVTIDMNSDNDKESYALGYNYGSDMSSRKITDFNTEQFAKGFREGQEGTHETLTEEELNVSIQSLREKITNAMQANQEPLANPNADIDRESYALGYNYGADMASRGIADYNVGVLELGFKEGLTGTPVSLTQEELNQALANLNNRVISAMETKAEADAMSNPENIKRKADGEAFLRENGNREGVITLPNGIQYEILKEGTGDPIGSNAVVKTHYKLSFPGGEVWQDNVYDVDLVNRNSIRGWLETIPLMKKGSIWNIYLPYTMGYGTQDRGQIKPFQALQFEIEILEITQK